MNRPPHLRDRGFTLMEALVTLVLLSVLSGIIWQALAQTARVERLLSAGALEPQTEALRLQWMRAAIESLVPLTGRDPNSFRGTESQMTGLASEVPGWPESPAAVFKIELVHDALNQRGQLLLHLEGDAESPPRVSISVLQWQGRPGSIRYLGLDGQWASVWPPAPIANDPRVLPLSVGIATGSDPPALIVAAPRSGGIPRITRSLVEQL